MPLTDEQKQALAALKTTLAELPEEDIEEAAGEIRSAVRPVWDHIHDLGHTRAIGTATKQTSKMTKDLEAARRKITELEEAQSNGGTPDQQRAITEARAEIARLTKSLQDKDKEVEQRELERERDRIVSKVEMELVKNDGPGRVRPSWLKLIKTDPDLRARIQPKHGDNPFAILQHGKTLPISAEDDTEEAYVAALAKEIKSRLKKEDPDALAVEIDPTGGAGVRTGTDDGGAGEYDAAKEGKEMAARQKNQTGNLKDLAMR